VNDPLLTGTLRDAALAAWAQHPVRFREDANTEEDHARGYYRDRVVVELAQNAADAAARAGVVGRLLLRLTASGDDTLLVAANTGAPLDAAGVASLASLRASAKRGASVAAVGRFGVGFAAVRSVCDEVSLVSGQHAVHFSLDATRGLLAEAGAAVPGLADEVGRRGSWLPVLRLPLPGAAAAHDAAVASVGGGWGTVVVLTLRDRAAVDQVRAQLAAVDDVLLLALPALTEVTVADGDTRVVADVADRWVVARRSGSLDPALLEDRPVEERDRTGWQVTWAVQRTAVTMPSTVHAPTPTDEPCTVPARLIGTFPLDPTRRHVAPGRLTDVLVANAGRVWTDLLVACRDDDQAPDLVDLLPGGLPAGALDAAIRSAVLAATRTTPVLRPAAGGGAIAPAGALVLSEPVDPAAARLLGERWPALVDLSPRRRHLARLLEIPTMDLADVVAGLPTLAPEAAHLLYDVFDGADPGTLEQLATMPVPLVDGRTVHGPRGLVLLDGQVGDAALAALSDWGVRVVHPQAAHRLLERLGAQRSDIAGLLRSPAVRERVLDDDEPAVADVVLSLVDAALRAGTVQPESWWGELLLPAADGEMVPARGLVLGGSEARQALDAAVLPTVDSAVQERWGAQVLTAVGVRAGLAVLRVPLDLADATDLAESLDGWDAYRREAMEAGDGPPDALVVADLDAVMEQAWPHVLAALASEHRAVLEPVRLLLPDGPTRVVPSYTTWWLRNRAPLGLGGPFALAGGPAWLGPAPSAVAGLDEHVQRLLGGVGAAEELDAQAWAVLLGELRTGDPVAMPVAAAFWRALARLAGDLGPLVDAEVLPALGRGGVQAVAADDVAVASPMWVQHPASLPVVVVPAEVVAVVADALDLETADERADGRVTSRGEPAPTPDAVRLVFPRAPATWMEHEDLMVDGAPVQWWVDSQVHAATTSGLARGLAELVGARQVGRLERLLGDPGAVDEVLLDLAGEEF